MMRIDAHIHYMPPELADNLTDLTSHEPYWELLLCPHSVQGWSTAEQLISDMDQAGLEQVILVGEYFRQHTSCVTRNNRAIELVQRWPDRIIAFAALQPNAGTLARRELRRCLAAGFRGVGELNPYAQGFSLDDPDFLQLVELCIQANLPINLHVNETVGHYYPGKATVPLHHYYRLAERYPDLKLILAHWGGGLFFYELMPAVRRVLQNVWYDTAASPLLYPTKKIFNVALRCIDHKKILYGSDYPLLLYPRKQEKPDFRPFIRAIDSLSLDTPVYEGIMGENVTRLLEKPVPGHIIQVSSQLPAGPIEGMLPVALVAEAYPQTRPIFEGFGIPWRDQPAPHWEPIAQAAAAQGQLLRPLLDALNDTLSASADE
jgi:predicted TIM-barrel fold metal-dependent hydrolase